MENEMFTRCRAVSRLLLVAVITVFSAGCGTQESTSQSEASGHSLQDQNNGEQSGIEKGSVALSLTNKKDVEAFGKPACDLTVRVSNGLDTQVQFRFSGYELMGANPAIVGGLGDRFVDSMSVDKSPMTIDTPCNEVKMLVVRETLCSRVDAQGQLKEDCRKLVTLAPNETVQLMDKRFY